MCNQRFAGMLNVLVVFVVLLCPWIAASSDTSVQVPAVIVPPAGTVASFLVTEVIKQEVINRDGFFVFVPVDDLEESQERLVGVRYTVLSIDDGSLPAVRILAEAQALDPVSARPLPGKCWESVYIVTPDNAQRESGHVVPMEYADLVSPSWLGNWHMTPAEQLPVTPLYPGEAWHAEPYLVDLDDSLPLQNASLPVRGTFIGWLDHPDGLGRAAVLRETGIGTAVFEEELLEDMFGQMDVNVSVDTEYWHVPGDFGLGLTEEIYADMAMSMESEALGLPGLSGTLTLRVVFSRIVERHDAGPESWFTASGDRPIHIGERLTGTLGSCSDQFDDGTAMDVYVLDGSAGELLTFRLESDEFDAYLLLYDHNFDLLAQDDDSAGGTNSLITYTLPYSGPYYIVANTVFAGESGGYLLSVERGAPIDYERALELIALLQYPGVLTETEIAEVRGLLERLMHRAQTYQ